MAGFGSDSREYPQASFPEGFSQSTGPDQRQPTKGDNRPPLGFGGSHLKEEATSLKEELREALRRGF
ncbi:hypothetical protein FDECE_3366 [Fusarium decemcellulare]|nr:hypothetical protein FDECE_3366 [Fusarium decemcellulare]